MHEISKQIDFIYQTLSSSDRPIALFLGAGCPQILRDESDNPLIPDLKGLTTNIACKLTKESTESTLVWNAIKIYFSEKEKPEANLEDILSFLRDFKKFTVKQRIADFTFENLTQLEKEIGSMVVENVDKRLPDEKTAYDFVASWICSFKREIPIEIFTTNYDLLIENALERNGVPYFDGFIGTVVPKFSSAWVDSSVLTSWSKLWKIHGSINWTQQDSGEIIRVPSTQNPNVLILPSHLKYDQSRKLPYLSYIDRLRDFLRKPNAVLLMIGYSFNDQHINDVILQGLEYGNAHVFGLLYGSLANYNLGCQMASNRSNLSLLAKNEGLIGTRKGPWKLTKSEKNNEILRCSIVEVENGSSGELSTNCSLGDFSSLGKFFSNLIGLQEN